jgi:hypothetical protein
VFEKVRRKLDYMIEQTFPRGHWTTKKKLKTVDVVGL